MESSFIPLKSFSIHVSGLDIRLHLLEVVSDSVGSIYSAIDRSIAIELASILTVGTRAIRGSSSEELLLVSLERFTVSHLSGDVFRRISLNLCS